MSRKRRWRQELPPPRPPRRGYVILVDQEWPAWKNTEWARVAMRDFDNLPHDKKVLAWHRGSADPVEEERRSVERRERRKR